MWKAGIFLHMSRLLDANGFAGYENDGRRMARFIWQNCIPYAIYDFKESLQAPLDQSGYGVVGVG